MKSKLLAPRAACREMMPNADTERMVESGSWVYAVVPKKRTTHNKQQCAYYKRRLDAGFVKLSFLAPRELRDELQSRLLPGETMAQLLERLLSGLDSRNNSMEDPDN